MEGIHYTVEVIVHEVHDAIPPQMDSAGRDRRVIDLTRVTTRSVGIHTAITKAITLLNVELDYQAGDGSICQTKSDGGIIK